MPEREKQDQPEKQPKIVEQDPKEMPQKAQPQVPDVNPGQVQPGHRDREQI